MGGQEDVRVMKHADLVVFLPCRTEDENLALMIQKHLDIDTDKVRADLLKRGEDQSSGVGETIDLLFHLLVY